MKTTTPATRTSLRLLTALLLSAFSLQAFSLFGQTVITGTQSGATLSLSSGTTIISAGARVFRDDTGAQITGGGASAMTLIIQAGGQVGRAFFGEAPTNLPVVGIGFSGAGYATVINYGTIIMGHAPTAVGTVEGRYALRVNASLSASGATIQNHGYLFGSYFGVLSLYAAEFKVVNTGTLQAVGVSSFVDVPERAIFVKECAPLIDINNSGLITAGVMGIAFYNEPGAEVPGIAEQFIIVNSGIIETTKTTHPAVTSALTSPAGGIVIGRVGYGGGSGGIENKAGATIRGYFNGITNTGTNVTIVNENGSTIQGSTAFGILSNVNANQAAPFTRVFNTGGLITGGSAAINFVVGSGSIINTAGGSISGGNGIMAAGEIDITNAVGSSIIASATTPAAAAIVTTPSGVLTLDNAGLVTGFNRAISIGGASSITNTGTISVYGDTPLASIFFTSTNADHINTLTLGNGSVVRGNVLSARAAGNHLVLQGSGNANSSFLGADSTGAFNAANGFESLTVNNASWSITGTVVISGDAHDAISINSSTLTIAGDILSPGNAGLVLNGGVITLTGNNSYGDTLIQSGLVIGNIGKGDLIVAASGTYRMAAASPATFSSILGSGVVDFNGNNITFDIAAGDSGAFDFAGTLLNYNNFVKTGAGDLVLANSIACSQVFIKDGVLTINSLAQIASAAITLGDTASRGIIDYSGAAAWTKNLALDGLGGGLGIASGVTALTATVSGSGDFVKAGAGALDITGATMNQTGHTRVDGGILRGNTATIKGDATIAAGATIEFLQPANATHAGLVTGDGALLKTGAGALTLTGANNYGDTRVAAGILAGNIGHGTLTVDSGATFRMNPASDTTFSGLLGAGTVDFNNNAVAFDSAAGVTGTFAFTGAMLNAGGFVKTGAGLLVLTNTLAFASTSIKEGAVSVDSQSKLGAATTILGSATSRGAIDYTGSDTWTRNLTLAGLGGGMSVTSGTGVLAATISGAGDFVKTGSGTLDIRGATLNQSGAILVDEGTLRGDTVSFNDTITVAAGATAEFFQPSGNATHARVVTGDGTLLKTGEGTLTLTGANSYGDTRVAAGILVGNLGRGSLIIETSGTYRMAANAGGSLSGILGNGTLDLNGNDLAFDIGAGLSDSLDFQGTLINASNDFRKTGAGTLVLSSILPNINAFIKNGVVSVASQDRFGAAAITLGDAATAGFIEYTSDELPWTKPVALAGAGGGFLTVTNTAFFQGVVTGDAPFIKDGPADLNITGATFENTGGAIVRAGRLSSDAASMPLDVRVESGAVVVFDQTGEGRYEGVITGGGAFLKDGPGTVVLANPVQYTAHTYVAAGILRAGAKNIWLSTSLMTVAAGGTLSTGGFDQTISTLSNSGAVVIEARVNSTAGIIHSTDKFIVTTAASGTGKVLVDLKEFIPGIITSDWPSTAVVFEYTGAGSTNYSTGLVQRAISGAYEWEVVRSPDGKTYSLTTDRFSPEIPAIGGIDVAAYLAGAASIESLGNRLMAARREITDGKHDFQVWLNGLYRHDTLGNSLYDKAAAKTNGIQAGADWNNFTAGEGVPVTIGIFYDHAWNETNFTRNLDHYIRPYAKTSSDGFGLYASYRPGIYYFDAMIRTSKEKYEIFVPGTPSFRARGRGTAVSIEGGAQVAGPGQWKLEPQLQLTLQTHRVDSFTDSFGRGYDISGASSKEARAGIRLWREYPFRNGVSRIFPHARASFLYDWDGKGAVTVRPAIVPLAGAPGARRIKNNIGGGIFMLDAGATCLLTPWCSLGAAMSWSTGTKLDGFGATATLTFRW